MNSTFYAEKLSDSLKNHKIAIGPSALVLLADGGMLADDWKPVVPANLIRLAEAIRDGSEEHQHFLLRVIRYFRRGWHRQNKEAALDGIKMLAEKLLLMKETNQLDIVDEADEEIETALSGLYTSSTFEIALSPKRNFLRDYLIAIYSWARKTGSAILEVSQKVFSDVGHHLAALQLPDWVVKRLVKKREILDEISRNRTQKIFLAIILILIPDPTTLGLVFSDP